MFVLTSDQRYIADILEETRFLRADQAHRLLGMIDAGKNAAYAKRVLSQLQNINRAYWTSGDTVTLPHLRDKPADTDMLAAVDVMLDILDTRPLAISRGKPPFKLSFLARRGEEISAYAVAAVPPGGEEAVSLALAGRAAESTVIFLLPGMERSGLIRADFRHYFAVPGNHGFRYFKGK